MLLITHKFIDVFHTMHLFILSVSFFSLPLFDYFFLFSPFFCFLLLFHFSFSFSLKFFQSLLLFQFFFLLLFNFLPFNYLLAYILTIVLLFVHHFYKIAAFFTFVGFTAAKLIMSVLLSERNHFLTKFAWFWFFGTCFIMITIFEFESWKTTRFAADCHVLLFLMLLFFRFWNTCSAFLALIILPEAAHFMHSEFADVNCFFTHRASFCFNGFFHFLSSKFLLGDFTQKICD